MTATPETYPETSDINVATFIRFVKNIETAGHRFVGDQLRIRFRIRPEELRRYTEEYLNSHFALYDATKRNFLRLLKEAK